ncbi:hypothetical protein C2W62_14375 [Candidatus Entotheonella serta]|nr:hypothetical protein C2W62_14375 [Candidatus Entotheonella serta]
MYEMTHEPEPNLDLWLQQLIQQGIELWVEGDQLRIRAPQGVLTPELRETLTARKAALMSRLQRSTQGSTPLPMLTLNPEARDEPFPLTDIQYAFWIGQTAGLDLSGGYHVYMEYECVDLDVSRLNHAWQTLIQRHEMLRAVVLPPDQQKILDQPPQYQIPILDLVHTTEADQYAQLQRVREELSH